MDWLKQHIAQHGDDVEFLTETQVLAFNELIVAKMKEHKVSRSELAQNLGVSKAFVTKMLNGNHNMTIKTMVGVAKALNCRINLEIYPKGFAVGRKALYVCDSSSYDPYEPGAAEEQNACCA